MVLGWPAYITPFHGVLNYFLERKLYKRVYRAVGVLGINFSCDVTFVGVGVVTGVYSAVLAVVADIHGWFVHYCVSFLIYYCVAIHFDHSSFMSFIRWY